MKIDIFQTKYKNIDAVGIESRSLKAKFLLRYGAKLASFMCKDSKREFLVQADGKMYRKLKYAGDYVAAECSGFDDMFPTIDEYTYEEYPWKGVIMPDHGEVCSLPWEYEIIESNTCLHAFVYSVRFAYRLDKWIRFTNENELAIEYKAKNLSPYNLDFLWAAHVMINAEQNAKLVLPYDYGSKMTCVFSADESFLHRGKKLTWLGTDPSRDYTKKQQKNSNGNTYKYYFDEALPEGWCGYRYCDGTKFMLKVTKETVPYLGIWINNGLFKGYHNIALEPCTGTFDDPGRAAEHRQNSVLPGGGEYVWCLSIGVIN